MYKYKITKKKIVIKEATEDRHQKVVIKLQKNKNTFKAVDEVGTKDISFEIHKDLSYNELISFVEDATDYAPEFLEVLLSLHLSLNGMFYSTANEKIEAVRDSLLSKEQREA
jgi:hypothetical protein